MNEGVAMKKLLFLVVGLGGALCAAMAQEKTWQNMVCLRSLAFIFS